MELSHFWTLCSANSIVLDKDQLRSLERFHDEIIYWNEKVNLISRKDIAKLYEHHILHSLSILKYIDIPPKAKCLDVGTGGGFPGIPLKIALPESHFLLVDSIAKKIKITDMLAKHTGLKNISAKCIRAEELAKDSYYLRHFDFVFSRAVAKIAEVAGWVKPLLKKNGRIVLLKGGDLTAEIAAAKQNHQNLVINEQNLSIFGFDWFTVENKKIVVCSFE